MRLSKYYDIYVYPDDYPASAFIRTAQTDKSGPKWSVDSPCRSYVKWCSSSGFVRVQQLSDLTLRPQIICDVPLNELYELQRSTAQLGQSCLPEPYAAIRLLWLTVDVKNNPGEKACFSGDQSRVHNTASAGPPQRVLLGWSRNKVAYACTLVQSQPRQREKAPAGHTVSSAIWLCAGEKTKGGEERGRC